MKWIKNEKPFVFVSLLFLFFQILISYILWHRTGDIPPGFGDSLIYIYGINKLIIHHNLFPYTYYLNFSEHFTYIGYNSLMGVLGILTGFSGEKIFHYSFFFGKIVLLLALVYLLKGLFAKEKKATILSLLFLAFFVGDGSIHGFFWVVPSFFMVIIFFILFGLILDERHNSYWLLVPLSFFYVTIHPISSYSVIIFIIFTALSFFWYKEMFRKSLKITTLLTASVIIFQIVIALTSQYSYLYYKDSIAVPNSYVEFENKNNSINSLAYSISSMKDTSANSNIIQDSVPNISFKLFNKQIEKSMTYFSKYLPSMANEWNSYYSWFYRIPPLLILLCYSIYSNYRAGRKNLLGLYFSSLFFSLGSIIHPFGGRSIIFLFPITIILFAAGVYDLYFEIPKFFKKLNTSNYDIIRAIYIIVIAAGLVGFGFYGITTVKSYSKLADYKAGTEKCFDYIKTRDKKNVTLYFSSIEGINYFLSHGFDGYKIASVDKYDSQDKNTENIFIFENTKIINNNDIDMPLLSQDKLESIIKDNNGLAVKNIECGIFQLYDTKIK